MSTLLQLPQRLGRQVPHHANDFVHAKRLGEKMAGALPEQLARVIVAWITGHETNRDIGVVGLNASQSLGTIETWHLNVKEDERDLRAVIAAVIEGFLAAACCPHVEPFEVQVLLQRIANEKFVIDNENASALLTVERGTIPI
jgi:hypothetical protein